MASILRVNTLTDASSNNSVPMATVASGSAKAFEIHTDDLTTLIESFNTSSITDGSTGICSPVFTNNMATVNYFTAASAGQVSDTAFGIAKSVRSGVALSTSTYTYTIVNSANTLVDRENTMSCNHGDLA